MINFDPILNRVPWEVFLCVLALCQASWKCLSTYILTCQIQESGIIFFFTSLVDPTGNVITPNINRDCEIAKAR